MMFLSNLRQIFALFLSLLLMVGGVVVNLDIADTEEEYRESIGEIRFYDNTIETAIPQTAVADLINSHFYSALPEGKTVKKAIIIGYDGGRADSLQYLQSYTEGAVYNLINKGGHAYIGYCGGVNYPSENTQKTSTAPGWCSILTGCWADVHGITGNGIPKADTAPLTNLTSLVENKVIDSSVFYCMWDGHFVDSDSTYINEKAYVEKNGLNVTFKDGLINVGTYKNTCADLLRQDCSDYIFCIFEQPDTAGHSTGFSSFKATYGYSLKMSDTAAQLIIDTIESRATYNTEDWLIVLASDHGGIETGHGGASIQERMTFIVTNKNLGFNDSPNYN